jgi:hypothetical protein
LSTCRRQTLYHSIRNLFHHVTKSKNNYQQSRRKCGPETKSREDAISKNQKNIEEDISILHKHQAAISINKYDLGLAKDFKHRIHLKDDQPIY